MEFTARQIAEYLHGTVEGDADVKLSELSKIEEGREGTLTFLSNPKYTHYIYTTGASACLVNEDFVAEEQLTTTLIRVPDAYGALASLLRLVESVKPKKQGIHPSAVIDSSATLGDDVYVGAHAVIGANVTIGANCTIYPNVTIYDDCVIGNNCILHAGAVIGADGFGFAPNANGEYDKIPQIGNVILEDNVDIGANATIDRATMGSTIVRKGAKIDNLVQIAHNVEIGENTVVAAQSGVAGTTKIGKHCMLGGQVGISGHLNIADGSIFAAKTGVSNNIKEANQMWFGYPHLRMDISRRVSVVQRHLPDMQKKIYALEKEIKILNELIAKK